jgi:uncharacterized protein (TIGR02231 family)
MRPLPDARAAVALTAVAWLAGAPTTEVLAAESQPLATRIIAVTVYSDRAQVTRAGAIELDAAPQRFVVSKLPGWIDAESVRVALDPPSAGHVLDVAVETAYLVEASEETVRKAQAALRDVTDDIAAIADEERTLNEEITRLEALRALSIDKVPRELVAGAVPVKTLGETMAFVTDTVRADRKQLRALGKKRRDLDPLLAQRQKELADVQARAQLQQSAVTVEVRGSGRAHLRVVYMTPGAAWEPVSEVRVSRGGATVSVAQFASVTQTTGEDWSGAGLSFSTQNASTRLVVPRAEGLVLDGQGDGLGQVVDRAGQSFSRAQAIYNDSNEQVARNKANWRESLQRQLEVQARAAEHFVRIARRGTTAHFTALSARSVRADGKAVRVPISSGEFTAATRLVAVPDESLNAVRVADLRNGGGSPLLPGPTALFEDGAFVGRSELDFVAPGESFSVFLGVHDGLKLERVLDKKVSALKRRGKRSEMSLSFVVTAENLGNSPVAIELSERVPVAQSEEIEVNDLEMPNKVKPDAHGIVKWTATLAPRQKLSWRVGYKLAYPSDLVARARAAEGEGRSPPPAPPAPAAAPAPTRARMKIHEQIDYMEQAL